VVRHLQLNPGQIQGANQPNSSSRHTFYYKKPPCRLLTAKICNLLKLGEVLLISNMKTRIFAAAILNLEAILKLFSIMFMKLRNSTGMQNLVFLALTVLVEI
jgi:hypothetical protein